MRSGHPREQSPRQNGLWAVAQQVATLALTGVFSIVLVRFVSVAEFGIYNYAVSLASLGVAIMVSGLQGLAIKEFRTRREASPAILASLFFLRESMAVLVYILFVAFTLAQGESDVVAPTLIAILAVLARILDAPELWFQARLLTRTPALIRVCSAISFFVVRILALLFFPSVIALVLLFVIEQVVNGFAIGFAYWRRTGRSPITRPELVETRTLARRALPLSLSGIANQVNLRSDILIIQALSGSVSVGLYSAAARLSEILYALPTAYMNATFPSLLDVRKQFGATSEQYYRALQQGFDAALWFGWLVVLGALVTADWVVVFLFGADYQLASAVLKVHVLACPFVFMAAILSKWIVAENQLWISLLRHSVGAVLAIALNFVLIPKFGIVGSAWATVVSYAAASYLFCFFTRSTRQVAWMMTKAFFAPARYPIAHFKPKRGDGV
jgi:O-antigen/teichoic acid export membrane protein